MEILPAEICDQENWNNFVQTSELGSFLQSWEWGDFQESLGNRAFRLKIIENDKIIAIALIIKHKLPRNLSWLYCPRGPVLGIRNWDLKIGQALFAKIAQIAKKEKAIFLKIEPKVKKPYQLQIPEKFKKSPGIQPASTLVLPLEISPEKLLAQMHHKTRYNIRLAEKRGVQVRVSENFSQDIEAFYKILSETSQNQKFDIFKKEHYDKLLRVFGKNGRAKLYLAEHQNEVVAGILVSFFGSDACYLHGGSLPKFHQVMAPHLLQWQAIQDAQKNGQKFYDFWGVAPADQSHHKWLGLTRFKLGFGGERVNYLGGFDLVFVHVLYQFYRGLSFLRRKF
ncbi:MAG TPA: peptidoglycan bridge formation glycyltransferase FemA/FemB family protein [Patescibacteria group bacterium]|nr:peptidoglycan bridge formation glycyltransferase FemA/FemB family protein [Patescibacteria group bacterium]